MSIGTKHPLPKACPVVASTWQQIPLEGFAATQILRLDNKYGEWEVARPEGDVPTLDGLPDDMDLVTAQTTLTYAARWLEHVVKFIARAERNHGLWKGQAEMLEQRLKYRHKDKLHNALQEDYDALERAQLMTIALKAELTELKSVERQITKVQNAASRSLTAGVRAPQ